MLNIQFMTEENKKIDRRGKEVYVPDFEELKKHACCLDELKAIEECEKHCNERDFGFTFEIVYTDFDRAMPFNAETGKQEFKMKWQVMQHPWYRMDGEKLSKREMVKSISAIYCSEYHYWNTYDTREEFGKEK